MILYIYWMAFSLACFVAWGEWWIRIPLLIIVAVFLFLAHREYREQQEQVELLRAKLALTELLVFDLLKEVAKLTSESEGDEDEEE